MKTFMGVLIAAAALAIVVNGVVMIYVVAHMLLY